jgi:hypothetical protein
MSEGQAREPSLGAPRSGVTEYPYPSGLSGLDDAQVKLTSDGFLFAGELITPPRHWETLLADLTPHQVQAAKKLAGDRT